MRLPLGVVTLAAFAFLVACGSSGPTAVTATFDVGRERFRVRVTSGETVTQLQRLMRGEGRANIPNGRIVRGAGNEPWSWRLEDVELAEFTAEVCDGMPSYVEANLDEFLRIGHYCPWQAKLVSIQSERK